MQEHTPAHVLTVGLEDYFQVAAFNRVIQRGQWYRFEPSVERGTRATLELLAEHDVKATFFVLGWVAEKLPEIIRGVADAGHQVGSKGYFHRGIGQMTPEEFREDLQRSREAIEAAAGQAVCGYRVADGWFRPSDLWALSVLAEEGFKYDSSVALIGRRFAHEPWRRFVHTHTAQGRTVTEFPISSARIFGQNIPIAGGNYFRQLPGSIMRRMVSEWTRLYSAPFVMYFHTWEMDMAQPRIHAGAWLQRIRHYRHLDRMPEILSYYLSRYRFTSIGEHLDLPSESLSTPRAVPSSPPNVPVEIQTAQPGRPTPVSVVVPCYNEEVVIPYLKNTLERLSETFRDRYSFKFVFVDDASTDDTLASLIATFEHHDGCKFVARPQNGGVARAVLSGIEASDTELVCSIDCDCSYDPVYLGSMIPLVEEGADLVTASPYHPAGGVRNVPGWRLFLSKTLSRMYRIVLAQDLHTFTACFRVYRRSSFESTYVDRGGFLGVAEMLGRLALRGGVIREYPAVLETRIMGRSKMKALRTILGHLGLLLSLTRLRLRRGLRRADTPLRRKEPPRDRILTNGKTNVDV